MVTPRERPFNPLKLIILIALCLISLAKLRLSRSYKLEKESVWVGWGTGSPEFDCSGELVQIAFKSLSHRVHQIEPSNCFEIACKLLSNPLQIKIPESGPQVASELPANCIQTAFKLPSNRSKWPLNWL